MVNWIKEFTGAVTICDKVGIILKMNEQACKVFEKYGGESLIGSNLIECHPEPAHTKLKELLDNPKTNAYSIEKNGQKKLIYQTPWFDNGEYAGLVEISLPLPEHMPHFVRSTKPK